MQPDCYVWDGKLDLCLHHLRMPRKQPPARFPGYSWRSRTPVNPEVARQRQDRRLISRNRSERAGVYCPPTTAENTIFAYSLGPDTVDWECTGQCQFLKPSSAYH